MQPTIQSQLGGGLTEREYTVGMRVLVTVMNGLLAVRGQLLGWKWPEGQSVSPW